MRRRRAALLAVASIALPVILLAAGCSARDAQSGSTTTSLTTVAPAPAVPGAEAAATPAILQAPDGWIAPDTRGVVIPPIVPKNQGGGMSDKPTLAVGGGTSAITGTVFGPDGPVGGARVRLERFFGLEWGFLDVDVNEDGRYHATGLLGGRYRIRAWHRPSLATTESQTVFVRVDQTATVDVGVEHFEGTQLQGAIIVAEPHVGEDVFFKALYTRIEVADDGIVRAAPIPGWQIQITALEGMKVMGNSVEMTAEDGFATFVVQCQLPGAHSVIIDSGEKALAVGLPPCLPGELKPEDVLGPPRPTTTRPATTTTTRRTTTTTRPTTTTSRPTTTTTRPGGR